MLDWNADLGLVLLLIGCVLGIISGVWWIGRGIKRTQRRRVARRAALAEEAALTLLQRHGYELLDTQVEQLWQVQHGDQQLAFHLRVDAKVRRNGRDFIAEVKSGALVSSLRHAPTRRQLLEYAVAYEASGVLLVDMQRRRIEEVIFPQLPGRVPCERFSAAQYWLWFLVSVIAAVVFVAKDQW